MKMQYMLFYNPVFFFCHAFCLTFSSPHSLLYCTNSPNISYAMSRLLTFQAASTYSLIISSHRMSVPRAELIRTQLGSSSPRGWTTWNNLCLSVRPCHKTLDFQKRDMTCTRTHTHYRNCNLLVSSARISRLWHNRATQTGNDVTAD